METKREIMIFHLHQRLWIQVKFLDLIESLLGLSRIRNQLIARQFLLIGLSLQRFWLEALT